MSVFNWLFGRTKTLPMPSSRDSSGLPSMDATRPIGRSGVPSGPSAPARGPARVNTRKTERMAKRELLYSVVREAMGQAGVLPAGYKFKVLSLDPLGRQFLIMVDLARGYDGATSSLPEIEAMVAQQAKTRHEIVVTAVYWRMIEHVAMGKPSRPAATPVDAAAASSVPPAAAATPATPEVSFAAPQAVASARGDAFEPLKADEIEAFRRALASGVRPESTAARAGAVPAAQNYALLTGFEDTELSEADGEPQGLSGTQYGELR